MKRYDAGIQGEQEAENALTRQGMTLRTRRYRAEDGEIDLVMQDGETIVFVEVKARPQTLLIVNLDGRFPPNSGEIQHQQNRRCNPV